MPQEVNSTGAGEEHSVAEDVALLSEGEVEEKEVKEVEEQEEVKEEEVEEKEEEKEEEEKTEEDETKDFIKQRPSFKEVTAKYPNLFKDFPDLREMYFREQKYTETFATVEDAKEAATKAETYDSLDELVSSGKVEDASKFLGAIKENDVEVFKDFAHNFLPALRETSPDDWLEVTLPISQDLVRALYAEGARLGEELGKNLRNAALQFANYFFNDVDVATGKRSVVKEREKRDTSLDEERRQFYNEKYTSFKNDVDDAIIPILDKEIAKSLDPNGDTFNEFMLETLTEKVRSAVDKAVAADPEHKAKMASLWKQAQKYGFTKEYKDRLTSAYLSRARSILPAIRNKIRSEALSNKKAKSDRDIEKSKTITSRREISSGAPQRFSSGRIDPKKVDYSRTSDRDILNDEVTLRK